MARLGTWLPFRQAARCLRFFWGVEVSEATVRRRTEAAGAAYVAVQEAEQARLERESPPPPPGPAVQQVSVDGAMVPLVGGEWAEVKTLAIGAVTARHGEDGPEARAEELSYFSRLADAATFTRAARIEFHARGTAAARTVVAVADGSEWIGGVLDTRCPQAVRVLDFPHAVEHVHAAGQATWGVGTAAGQAWLREQATRLKAEGAEPVLAALRDLPVQRAGDPVAAGAARDHALHYLEHRREHLRYPHFRALGYPIGSGAVESANKLVVEARLKGSGMHWARAHVNPMVALRTAECAERWDQAWPRLAARRRPAGRRGPAPSRPAAPPPLSAAASKPVVGRRPSRAPVVHQPPRQHPPRVIDGKPTADHPWKHAPADAARCPSVA